jgi:hypothetical protein
MLLDFCSLLLQFGSSFPSLKCQQEIVATESQVNDSGQEN